MPPNRLVLVVAALSLAGCSIGVTGSVAHTDPRGDAAPAWIDLTEVKVRGRGRSIEVTWTLAEKLPRRIRTGAGVELKVEISTPEFRYYEIVALRVGTPRRRTIVRFNGPGPPYEDERAPRPVVKGREVSVRVPLERLRGLRPPFAWTAWSYNPQPGVGDLVPDPEGVRRRLVPFPRGAKIPAPTDPPPAPGVVVGDKLKADARLVARARTGELWLRNRDPFEWRECWLFLHDSGADKAGFGRTLVSLGAGGRAYLHLFTFVRKGMSVLSVDSLRSLDVLCKTPRGWGRASVDLSPASTPDPALLTF